MPDRILLCSMMLLGASARALPPPRPPAAPDPEAEIARREAPEIGGHPDHAVRRLAPLLPHIYFVELSGGEVLQVMVVDGHLVKGRSDAALARYLQSVNFLETHDMSAARLAALLNQWGELPPGFEGIDATTAGPHGAKPQLVFNGEGRKDGAVFTTYARWQPVPKPPESGAGPVRVDLGRPRFLRGVLHVDGRSAHPCQLKWTVEETDYANPGTFKPFRG